MDKNEMAREAMRRLEPLYPDLSPLLDYQNPFELLCMVILSAQCTDAMVNKVSKSLFAHWPDAAAMARAEPAELEEVVHPAGFFRTKAAHIRATAAILARDHGGNPPATMEELLRLPGVGRKTANVILAVVHGQDTMIVDTHVLRVSKRLGLRTSDDPATVEAELSALAGRGRRGLLGGLLNRHGRALCKARSPRCGECPMGDICPSSLA